MKVLTKLLPILLVAALGCGVSGCANALDNFAKVTNVQINTVPTLKCNPSLTVPGCLTDGQVQQIEGDLNRISTAGAKYTLALMAVNGDAAKAILPFAVFIADVGLAEADIAAIAGPNAEAVVSALKSAVKRL